MNRSLEIFRALADPTRLRIVGLLRAMELAVGELAQVLGQSQPRVSRHAKILCDAGIARRRREGSWVFLCPGDSSVVGPLFSAMDNWVDGNHWAVADTAKLAAVRADRAAAAQIYFASHAKDWDAIRSLHVAESDVESAIERALGRAPIGRLVDIGTGTGRMIELFGSRAKHSIGVDRSPEMLRFARVKLADIEGLSHELRQGDITALALPDGSADTVIMHQVLHFIPAPEQAIEEAGRMVAPDGRLLIVDFAPHDHEQLRSEGAHTRLGFSDEQISGWCAVAGLDVDLVDELMGGTLTVKLWRATKRAEPVLKVVRS
jgi:ubiquinone/menaquinone biosynthesis C-methylase UbiE/DNA-binding transcriptional ArsR family regulator